MEIHRLLLLCTTFCLVQSVTYLVENINENNSDEPKDTPSWKIIETADEEEESTTCLPPTTHSFGHFEGSNYSMGATLTLKCDAGFKVFGSPVIRCVPMPFPFRLIVQWEPDVGPMPTCRKIAQEKYRSSSLPYVEEKTPDRSSVEYKIPTSSPNAPSKTLNIRQYEDIKCPRPQNVSCGSYEGTDYSMGSKVTLRCDPGCELVGQADLRCIGVPDPFRHIAIWDPLIGGTPSCRHRKQGLKRTPEEEETKPKRSPNEYVIEITEEEPKAPPYLASNGKPKQYTDEYGKFVEPEEIGNCNLPSYTGPCRGRLRHFYYDAESGECKIFRYGGCRGNANNFKTEKACKEFRRYCLSVHN